MGWVELRRRLRDLVATRGDSSLEVPLMLLLLQSASSYRVSVPLLSTDGDVLETSPTAKKKTSKKKKVLFFLFRRNKKEGLLGTRRAG